MPNSPQADVQESRNSHLILLLLSAVVFFAVINGTMVGVALPFIGRDFQVSEATYGWVVTGFALAFGIFNAIHGRLADIFGLRRLYLLGICVLGGASLLITFSPNIETMIALRVLHGAGSAAIPALGSTIITRIFPPQRRGRAMGMILGAVGLAASIGPFAGGLLVQISGWRAVFAFTAVALLAIPFALRLLPESLNERSRQSFDLFGAIFLSIGVSSLLYSFNIVEQHGFGSTFLQFTSISLLFLTLFGWRISTTSQPFVPPELFRDIRYIALSIVAAISNATRFGTIVLVPIFLIEVNKLAPVWVGVVLLPGALLITVISPISGRIADNLGARIPVAIGMLILLMGNLITAVFAGGNPIGVTVGMTLYGCGFALLQSPLVSATSQILPSRNTGVGLGIFMMIFFLGGAFGVALSVTTLELQGESPTSWLPFITGPGVPFSNAIFALSIVALIALFFLPLIPDKAPLPTPDLPYHK